MDGQERPVKKKRWIVWQKGKKRAMEMAIACNSKDANAMKASKAMIVRSQSFIYVKK